MLALELLVKPLDIHVFMATVIFVTKDHTGFFSDELFVLPRFSDMDNFGGGKSRNGLINLEDIAFSGVWPRAVVEDLFRSFLIDWFELHTNLIVFQVDIDLLLEWQIHLNLLVVAGDVLLVIEWSNEGNLGLGLGS